MNDCASLTVSVMFLPVSICLHMSWNKIIKKKFTTIFSSLIQKKFIADYNFGCGAWLLADPVDTVGLIDWYIFSLLSRESDDGAILWMNPHSLRSWPFSKFSGWPMTSSHINLLLVQSHQAEVIIIKRLIQGRNNVTRVRVEPMIMRSGSSKKRRLYSLGQAADTLISHFHGVVGF